MVYYYVTVNEFDYGVGFGGGGGGDGDLGGLGQASVWWETNKKVKIIIKSLMFLTQEKVVKHFLWCYSMWKTNWKPWCQYLLRWFFWGFRCGFCNC